MKVSFDHQNNNQRIPNNSIMNVQINFQRPEGTVQNNVTRNQPFNRRQRKVFNRNPNNFNKPAVKVMDGSGMGQKVTENKPPNDIQS